MTEEKNEVIFDDDKISKSEEFVNPDELLSLIHIYLREEDARELRGKCIFLHGLSFFSVSLEG